MHKQIINCSLQTINWLNDEIVDWGNAGTCYSLSGEFRQLFRYSHNGPFDASINSPDGQYSFIYQKRGTKGLLLKNDDLLREINRSYYHANAYEFPVAFIVRNGRTYLVHCPLDYGRLDFEDIETGELVTNSPSRINDALFHSRLEVSPGGKYLLNKGWVWHPRDVIRVYDIEKCFLDPTLLDDIEFHPDNVDCEIGTASFIDEQRILFATTAEVYDDEVPPKFPLNSFAIWDLENNSISKPVTPRCKFGNLVAINENCAWDMYEYPKLIDLKNGNIIAKDKTIFTGRQNSSILAGCNHLPQIALITTEKR